MIFKKILILVHLSAYPQAATPSGLCLVGCCCTVIFF